MSENNKPNTVIGPDGKPLFTVRTLESRIEEALAKGKETTGIIGLDGARIAAAAKPENEPRWVSELRKAAEFAAREEFALADNVPLTDEAAQSAEKILAGQLQLLEGIAPASRERIAIMAALKTISVKAYEALAKEDPAYIAEIQTQMSAADRRPR
jgi:hypothetical protein